MATTSPRGDIDLTNDGPNRMNTVGSRFDSSSATLNNMLRTQSKFKFTQSKNKEITENLIEESSKKSLMLTFPKSSSDRNIYFQELKRKTKPFSSPKWYENNTENMYIRFRSYKISVNVQSWCN